MTACACATCDARCYLYKTRSSTIATFYSYTLGPEERETGPQRSRGPETPSIPTKVPTYKANGTQRVLTYIYLVRPNMHNTSFKLVMCLLLYLDFWVYRSVTTALANTRSFSCFVKSFPAVVTFGYGRVCGWMCGSRLSA